ncbi:DUF1295 domain-containing protein [Streptomyces sp. SPB78]|uniref:DUF1295 domain-containing protein n=1 Tax=Streptomyces sp. (strain SPB78) TaxID=591157 RepID=UPI0001B578FB|nr:DUF1295 domain-containing protein [Streptomyces sp. SPB78]
MNFPWGAFALGLAPAAGASALVLGATWLLSRRRGIYRYVDSAWGFAFAFLAAASWLFAYGSQGTDGSRGLGDPVRAGLAAALTIVWGLRLGVHIARRGRGKGEDPRYDRMLSKAPEGTPRPRYALRVVTLPQAALVWLVSVPVQAAVLLPYGTWWVTWASVALWALGLFFEAVGDAQMARFKSDPAHKGKLIDVGLWRWTRHPNYFGDFAVWWGLWLLTLPAAGAPAAAWGPAAATSVSPLLMTYLLVFGSGKRLTERGMAEREGWERYAARTSGFLPWPPGVWPKGRGD